MTTADIKIDKDDAIASLWMFGFFAGFVGSFIEWGFGAAFLTVGVMAFVQANISLMIKRIWP
jgi:hypothetical protein